MNASRFTLAAANANTGWLDLRALTSSVSYIATGNFPGGTVVSIQYSNNEAYDKGSEFIADPQTITVAAGPAELPFGVARFVRFIMTGFAAGASVVISLARAKASANEQLVDVTAQAPTPTGPFST